MSECQSLESAAALGGEHRGHEVRRFNAKLTDKALECLPRGDFIQRREIARGSHIVLAQLRLTGDEDGNKPALLLPACVADCGEVMPRDLHRRAGRIGVGPDLFG